MKKILTFISFAIFSFFFFSCKETKEEEFFQRKFNTSNIEIVKLLECDSSYSPHADIEKIYRLTHSKTNLENFDTIFNEYLELRRLFVNPTFNNCIKKTYAIKVDGGELQLHSIYYVNHLGCYCMHDKEMILRQMIDIDHNFFHFKHENLVKEFQINEVSSQEICH